MKHLHSRCNDLVCTPGSGVAPESSHYQWSPSVRLQPLVESVQPNTSVEPPAQSQARVARHLSCQATQSGLLQASFCIGVLPSRTRAGVPCLPPSTFFRPLPHVKFVLRPGADQAEPLWSETAQLKL